DALGRRGPARQARARAGAASDRPHALHSRRAHDGPPLRRREEAPQGAARARRPRQHGGRHRAQPRRREDRRPRDRPRAGGRGARRRAGRFRNAGRGRAGGGVGDGAFSRPAAFPPARSPDPLEFDPTVITGFNTDVKHDTKVFHVQTEDRGLANPVVESLVYVGGEILLSKKSPYSDPVPADWAGDTLPHPDKVSPAALAAVSAMLSAPREPLPGDRSIPERPEPVTMGAATPAAPPP